MSKNRRDFFRRIGSMSAGMVVGKKVLEAQEDPHAQHMQHSQSKPSTKQVKVQPASVKSESLPVETPDVPKLPWTMVDGVKEFHLVAEPVRTDFVPGRMVDAWGYNGSVPGPTIEVNAGDRVRVIFENHL